MARDALKHVAGVSKRVSYTELDLFLSALMEYNTEGGDNK